MHGARRDSCAVGTDTCGGGAKRPALNRKKLTVTVGEKAVVKLKRGKKNAKVSWKTSKKSVVKILKKKTKTKGNKARAKIKGVSAGKAKITAVYKLGKKKTRLKCTVTVKTKDQGSVQDVPQAPSIIIPKNTDGPKAEPTGGPEQTAEPDVTPPEETPEAPEETPGAEPTGTPAAQATPDPDVQGIDLSGVQALYGKGKVTYNREDGSVTGGAAADGTALEGLLIPLGMSLAGGKKAEITVYGEASTGMRMWLSDKDAKRWSDIQDPAEFARTYTFTADDAVSGESEGSAESAASWFQIKGPSYGVTFDMLKITKVVVKDPDAVPTATPSSATEDPYAAELKVHMAPENVAYADTVKQEYHDGAVDLELGPQYSGLGICWYLNDAHESIDLSQYSKIIIDADSKADYEMAITFREGITSSDYWHNGSEAVGEPMYTVFRPGQGYEADIKNITGKASAIHINYNTYGTPEEDIPDTPNAEITINSIRLIKDPALLPTAPPTQTPTEEPTDAPTSGPESTPTAPPAATAEPDTRPGIDLSGTEALYGTGTVEATKDKVTGTKVEGLFIPLGFNLDDGRSVKVTVYGEASEGTRMWLSDADKIQYSVIQNPMAFGKEYTLTADKGASTSKASYASYLQIKGMTPGGTMSSITVTKVIVEQMAADETPEPKPTLAPGMVDLTNATIIGGKGAYNDLTERFEINDTGTTESQVFFEIPKDVGTVKTGETVTVTIKGTYSGSNGFRVWLGNGPTGRSNIQIFENLTQGDFNETFDLTATGEGTRITFKSITQPGTKPIDGLSIESIKVVRKGGAATAAPKPTATPKPATEAPATEAPAQDLKVNLTKANEAFSATDGKTVYNADGTVDVTLGKADSGHGVCYYLNDEHTAVDLAQYKSVIISVNSKDAYQVAISLKNEIKTSDYWEGHNSPKVGSEQYSSFKKGEQDFTLDISGIKDPASGIYIKYNTYDVSSDDLPNTPDMEFTLKSITLVKDPSYVPPEPTATVAPTVEPGGDAGEFDLSADVEYYEDFDTANATLDTIQQTGVMSWSFTNPTDSGFCSLNTSSFVKIYKNFGAFNPDPSIKTTAPKRTAGFQGFFGDTKDYVQFKVKNTGDTEKTYTLSFLFRFADIDSDKSYIASQLKAGNHDCVTYKLPLKIVAVDESGSETEVTGGVEIPYRYGIYANTKKEYYDISGSVKVPAGKSMDLRLMLDGDLPQCVSPDHKATNEAYGTMPHPVSFTIDNVAIAKGDTYEYKMKPGETGQLTVSASGTDTVVYDSSSYIGQYTYREGKAEEDVEGPVYDTLPAEVDANTGEVSAVSEGKTTVIAKITRSDGTAERKLCIVNVAK